MYSQWSNVWDETITIGSFNFQEKPVHTKTFPSNLFLSIGLGLESAKKRVFCLLMRPLKLKYALSQKITLSRKDLSFFTHERDFSENTTAFFYAIR